MCQGPVWTLNILAEIEEPTLAQYVSDAMDVCVNVSDDLEHAAPNGDADPRNVSRFTPPAFICPSADVMSAGNRIDTYDHDDYTSKGNYVACWGSGHYLGFNPTLPLPPEFAAKRGAFGIVMLAGWEPKGLIEPLGKWKMGLGQGTRFGEITDGSSNTLMISELVGVDSSLDGRGGWVLQSMGSSNFSAKWEPNARGVGVDPETSESLPKHDRIAMCDPRGLASSDPMFCVLHRTERPSLGGRSQPAFGRSQRGDVRRVRPLCCGRDRPADMAGPRHARRRRSSNGGKLRPSRLIQSAAAHLAALLC